MGYRKEITRLIIECWGKGLSAEETRRFIHQKEDIQIGLATVYRHRHSIKGQMIIDELFRQQRRDIALEQDSETRMKYRDKLLEKLIPQRIEALGMNVEKVEHVIKWQQPQLNTSSDTLPTQDNENSTIVKRALGFLPAVEDGVKPKAEQTKQS